MNSLHLNRRDTLKFLGGAGLAASAGLGLAQGQAPAASQNGNGFYRQKVGGFTVTVISDGAANLAQVLPSWGANPDLQDAFRKTLEENFVPAQNGLNHFSPVVVDTGKNKVLIDTGRGGTAGQLVNNLRNAGFNPADIDTVFITHAHPDHVGGLTANGAPVFPNARLVIGDTEFAFWTSQANPSAAVQANLIALRERYTFLKAGQEVVPGISTVASPGHTVGHLSALVASGSAQMMIFGDAAGHFLLSLRHPGAYLGFDANGPQAAQTRQELFRRVAAERVPVVGYHFPFPSGGYIRQAGSAFEYVPLFWSWN